MNSLTQKTIQVNLKEEVQPKVKHRHLPLNAEHSVYRAIGFSISGTVLFEFKNDNSLESKYICRVKPDFLVSFCT